MFFLYIWLRCWENFDVHQYLPHVYDALSATRIALVNLTMVSERHKTLYCMDLSLYCLLIVISSLPKADSVHILPQR